MKQIPIVLNENVQNQTIVKICFGGFLMSTEGLERDQWHGIGSKLLNKNAELSRCNILWNFAWHRHGLIHLVLNGLKYSPYIRLIPNLTRFFLFLRLLWFIAEILSSKKLNLNVCIYIYIYIHHTTNILAKLSTRCFEHSGDISCSLLVYPSHTDEYIGRNTCMCIYTPVN